MVEIRSVKTKIQEKVSSEAISKTNRTGPHSRRWFVTAVGIAMATCAMAGARAESGKADTRPIQETGNSSSSDKDVTPTPTQPSRVQEIEQTGVSVKFTLTPVSESKPRDVIYAGDNVEVRFQVTDSTTGSPITNLNPAAWIDRNYPEADQPETCHDKIESFLTGSLSARAEFDLNEFYVLALNNDPTISVVDPLFGYGGSKLLTMVQLPSPGEDWVLSEDASRLYVTLPIVNQVAVINTVTWKLIGTVNVGVQPTRIRMQPDGKYLWVSCVSLTPHGRKGNVYVIDTDTFEVADKLNLGGGHHDFVFSSDSKFSYISNSQEGSVFVVDVQALQRVATIEIGKSAEDLVYSSASKCVYVVDRVGGAVAVIDGRTHKIIKRIPDAPGLGTINVGPNDRFVFVANTELNTVNVIDTAKNAIIQIADVGPEPEQIIFSLNLAYVRSKGSEIVLMIPLDQVGVDGPLSVAEFTGGHTPFGLAKTTSIADGMALAPSGVAVVVANPVDKVVYYYREGMAAPMGEFSNYGREARAVLIVDRSLHEEEPGVYGTSVQLTSPGTFDIAFLLEAPRVVHCFQVEVVVRPGDVTANAGPPITVEPIRGEPDPIVGEPIKIRYQVRESATEAPVTNLEDFSVLVVSTGNLNELRPAKHIADGVYEATFVPPRATVYYVFCQIPSMGIRSRALPHSMIKVK